MLFKYRFQSLIIAPVSISLLYLKLDLTHLIYPYFLLESIILIYNHIKQKEIHMNKNALCIGINDYPGTGMDLRGCVNDAQDWSDTLGGRGYNVNALLDEQATKSNMIEAMSELIVNSNEGDSLVITFSGHGTYQPDMNGDEFDGLDEALCPYDIHTNHSALTDDEIRNLFSMRKPGVRLLLISDSCHSGTVARAMPSEDDDEATTRPRFMPMLNWLSEDKLPRTASNNLVSGVIVRGSSPFHGALIKQQGDLLLSGCQEGPNNYSYDAMIQGRFNGAFSYYALKTLKSLGSNASYDDWHRAVSRYLPSASYPQSPQIVGNEAARLQKIFA